MDGTKLASTSSDHKIIIWNLCGGNFDKSVELKGHNDFVDKIAWHPENENLLASVSIDKTVKFWDVRLKGSIRTEKTKNVYCNVVWSPDGKKLAVGGAKDNSINFYSFSQSSSQFSHQLK